MLANVLERLAHGDLLRLLVESLTGEGDGNSASLLTRVDPAGQEGDVVLGLRTRVVQHLNGDTFPTIDDFLARFGRMSVAVFDEMFYTSMGGELTLVIDTSCFSDYFSTDGGDGVREELALRNENPLPLGYVALPIIVLAFCNDGPIRSQANSVLYSC